jgi:hypothetical protein
MEAALRVGLSGSTSGATEANDDFEGRSHVDETALVSPHANEADAPRSR